MMTQIPEVAIVSPDGFYSHNCFVESQLIAKIEYDQPKGDIDCETQPWMVIVDDTCLTRFNTYAGAESYIRWHYKQKTLPGWTQQQKSESDSHLVQCVLKQREYVTIDGKFYCCGIKTKQIKIFVSFPDENAVMAMLDSLGLGNWDLVDWWKVKEFPQEPTF